MSRPYRTSEDERDVFRALAHSVRRKIVAEALDQTRSFEQLRDLTHRSDSALAGHLRILRDAGLLVATRNGRSVQYRVNQRKLRPTANWLAVVANSPAPSAVA